ncbi:MAG: ABC transporter permease [Corynebacterium sp.]|nr:ABC transporter permease [Corynebacterium sp.]
MKSTKLRHFGLQVVVFICFIAVWWLFTASGHIKEVFLPSPPSVVKALINSNRCVEISGGHYTCGEQNYFLWQHLLASLERIGVGVILAIIFGVALGYLLGMVKWIHAVVEPYLNFLRSLPPLGYMGLLIVWFGIGDASKGWLLFLAAFPPITLATIGGVKDTQIERIHAAQTLGASRMQVLSQVIIPSSLPSIMSGIRIAVGFAWTTVVSAELSNGIPGIGGLAYLAGTQLNTAVTIACIIVIGICALLLDAFIKFLTKVLVPWQGHD